MTPPALTNRQLLALVYLICAAEKLCATGVLSENLEAVMRMHIAEAIAAFNLPAADERSAA